MARVESAETTAVRRMAERERLADQRELLADEREAAADHRDVLADERDRVADELDRLSTSQQSRAPGAAAVGSRELLIESARGLESAQLAVSRSHAMLARRQVAVGLEDNAARQQDLAVAREMLSSKVVDAQRAHAETR